METAINIRDFFREEHTEPEKTKKTKSTLAPIFEIVTVSGPDFVIRRKTAKSSRCLVILMSYNGGDFYIKDDVSGAETPLTESSFAGFFHGIPSGESVAIQKDGESPFWISEIKGGMPKKSFSMIYLAMHNPMIRSLCCMNMYHIDGISLNADRVLSKTVDQEKLVKLFSLAHEHEDEEILKRSVAMFLQGFVIRVDGQKTCCLFNMCSCTYSYRREEVTSYDLLFEKWGIGGLRDFVSRYYHSPITDVVSSYDLQNLLNSCEFRMRDFFDYLFIDSVQQGYADNVRQFAMSWYDYLNLQKKIFGEIRDKYSEHLATDEQILSYRYRMNKREYDMEAFNAASDEMKKARWENDEYIITSPETRDDLIAEGQMQSNCVGSYDDRIIARNSQVYFLRKKEAPDKSFVTIEVRNGILSQVLAKRNTMPDTIARNTVDWWFENIWKPASQLMSR